MQMKQLRRKIAVIMSVVMALSSTGFTSLAATEDSGKKAITLHATEGKFTKASPSDASPSDATPSTASDATRKVEAYELDGKYWLMDADIPYGDLTAPDGNYKDTPVWLKEKDNAASAVILNEIDEYDVTDISNLYAGWLKTASGNSESFDQGAVTALGLSKDQTLVVNDLTEVNKISKDKIIADLDKGTYSNVDAEGAIQVDMSVEGGTVSENGVGIRITLPDEFIAKTENKSVVVLHYGETKPEVIEPEFLRESDGTIKEISFILHDFSPVVIATVDKMVDVTIENVKGGYVVAYSEDGTTGAKTFVPIGTTVKVPAGTILNIEQMAIGSADENGVTAKTGDTTTTIKNYTSYTVENNVTITGAFVKGGEGISDYYRVVTTPNHYAEAAKIESKLSIQKNGKAIAATDWTLLNSTDLFDLTSDGVLTSKDTLQIGSYSFEVNFTCEDQVIEGYGHLTIGNSAYFGILLGTTTNSGVADGFLGYTYVASGTTFADAKTAATVVEPGIYGGYTFNGWYKDGKGSALTDTYQINDYLSAYAGFYDSKGAVYKVPVILELDETVATPSEPTPGGSSGGGGGSSVKSENILYGTWARNDIGWYFLTNTGRYAQNEWGKINGVWYYFNNDQYMVTGWLFEGNNWYYLNPAEGSTMGAMQTGWLLDSGYNAWFYLSGSGAMQTDWQKVNGIWYYLNPVSDGRRGAMYANQWIEGYYVNQDGAWIEGKTQ